MGEPRRVLIVDDEPTILLSLSHFLKADGVEVITCSKIESAEEALFQYFFDLVITDLRMSGMYGAEGLELLSYIKAMSPKTEVILMTAFGSQEIREEAVRRGAYMYIEKPVEMADLLEKIAAAGVPVR